MMWRNFILSFLVLFMLVIQERITCQSADSSILVTNTSISDIKNLTALSDPACLSKDQKNEYFIDVLNQKTPLDLDYNPIVKKSIDRFLKERKRDLEIYLGRSDYYFPIIEQALDKYNLPLELKYIAVLESGLNPFAKSSSGAVGLWQFLYNTCSLFNLQVDSYIDERRDPYKATDAACKYLVYLYNTFQDWDLVLASYNGGPGEVRKAIERSGGKTGYWQLRPYLSKQASDYVPDFIAIIYLMNYYGQNGLAPVSNTKIPVETDSVNINYALSFVQISEVLGIPLQLIEQLNPQYRKNYIPKLEFPCVLILPKSEIAGFLNLEKQIIGFVIPPQPNYNSLVENAGSTLNKVKIVHVVEKGEYFHKIAIKYNCTIENIKAWNNLNTLSLFPGQILDIWVSPESSL
jgi:membrane-bound lytic murein transglycosylase D